MAMAMRNTVYQGKMRSDERYLIVKPMEGKHTLSGTGLVNNRIFKSEYNLYAKRNQYNPNLWELKFESGSLPGPLNQKFTSFNRLLEFTKGYMLRRNLEVTEVVDKWPSESQQ